MGVGLAVIYSVLYAAWQRAGRYLRSPERWSKVIRC